MPKLKKRPTDIRRVIKNVSKVSWMIILGLSILSIAVNRLTRQTWFDVKPADFKSIVPEIFYSIVLGGITEIIIKFIELLAQLTENEQELTRLVESNEAHEKSINSLVNDVNTLKATYEQVAHTLLNHIQNNADLVKIACLPISSNPREQAVEVWYEVLHRIEGSFQASSNIMPSAYKTPHNEFYYKLALEVQRLKCIKSKNRSQRNIFIERVFFAYDDTELRNLRDIANDNETHEIDVKCIRYDLLDNTSHPNVSEFLRKCNEREYTLDFIIVITEYSDFVITFFISPDRQDIEDVRCKFDLDTVKKYKAFYQYIKGGNVADNRVR
jgi:hypothetical protein